MRLRSAVVFVIFLLAGARLAVGQTSPFPVRPSSDTPPAADGNVKEPYVFELI